MAEDTEKQEKKKLEIPSLSEEELRTFVLAMCDNRIFSSAHLGENEFHLMPNIFMPLALGAFSEYDVESIKSIGLIYEYYDKAAPMAINGLPMFLSLKLLNASDCERVQAAIGRELQRRNEIVV